MMQTVLPACSVAPGPLCDGVDFLMFDNFPGEVSATNGKAPIIGSGTWSVTGGSAANARSGNGNLTLDVPLTGNAYAQIALGEVPGEIGCTFEYVGPLPDPDDGRPTPTLVVRLPKQVLACPVDKGSAVDHRIVIDYRRAAVDHRVRDPGVRSHP